MHPKAQRESGSPKAIPRWHRLRLRVPKWLEDSFVSFLEDQGIPAVEMEAEELEDTSVMVAYVEGMRSLERLEEALGSYTRSLEDLLDRSVDCRWAVEPLEDEDWHEAWKRHFRVTRVGRRFIVKPSWEAHQARGHELVLDIDPGRAFGTGLHASTRLCLQGIEEVLEDYSGLSPRRTGLDVGTGTGILAIAMAKVGLEQIVAIDPDSDAIDAARHNISLNGVGSRIRLLRASVEDLLEGEFDLVVANLTGPILRSSAEALRRRLSPGGILLVSGLVEEEVDAVKGPFLALGLRLLGCRSLEMWRALLMG